MILAVVLRAHIYVAIGVIAPPTSTGFIFGVSRFGQGGF